MKTIQIARTVRTAAAAALLLTALAACETKFYEDEQYRKEVYIVSNESNIAGQEYTFTDDAVGYLSIYTGGTTAIEEDVVVELQKNSAFLRDYNQRIFGDDFNSYAQELDPACYSIESMAVTLKASNPKPYTMLPIKVDISELDPDKTYFIPLRIKSVSKYMISEKKRDVLFRIYMKNDYASTKSTTYYTMNGTDELYKETSEGVFESQGVPTLINVTKSMAPIAASSVRVLPGTTLSSEASTIAIRSLNVTVHPDRIVDVPVMKEGEPTGETVQRQLVTITSWQQNSRSMLVGTIDGKQSYYDPETQEFTLNYRYKLPAETSWHFSNEVMTPLNITNK